MTIKIKVFRGNIAKHKWEVLREAEHKFNEILEKNPFLLGLLEHNIDEAFKNWNSSQEHYVITL